MFVEPTAVTRGQTAWLYAQEAPALNPPVSYGSHWWIAAAASVLLIIVLLWWCRRVLGRASAGLAADSIGALREQVHRELSEIRNDAAAGAPPRNCAGRMGACVRRFIGTVSDGDADFSTLPRIVLAARADARLAPLAEFAGWLDPQLFVQQAEIDVIEVHRRATEVVDQWR